MSFLRRSRRFLKNAKLQAHHMQLAQLFGLNAKDFVAFDADVYKLHCDLLISIARHPTDCNKYCAILLQFNSLDSLHYILVNFTEFHQNVPSSTEAFSALILCYWQAKFSDDKANRILITSDNDEILQNIRQALLQESNSNIAIFAQQIVKDYNITVTIKKGKSFI